MACPWPTCLGLWPRASHQCHAGLRLHYPMLKALPYTLAQLGGIVAPWKSRESRGRPKPNLSCKGLGDLFHLSKPQFQQRQNEDGAIKGPGKRPKTHTPVCARVCAYVCMCMRVRGGKQKNDRHTDSENMGFITTVLQLFSLFLRGICHFDKNPAHRC